MINSRYVVVVCVVFSAYALLRRYAEPAAEAMQMFCMGWATSDITRRIARHRAKQRTEVDT